MSHLPLARVWTRRVIYPPPPLSPPRNPNRPPTHPPTHLPTHPPTCIFVTVYISAQSRNLEDDEDDEALAVAKRASLAASKLPSHSVAQALSYKYWVGDRCLRLHLCQYCSMSSSCLK